MFNVADKMDDFDRFGAFVELGVKINTSSEKLTKTKLLNAYNTRQSKHKL